MLPHVPTLLLCSGHAGTGRSLFLRATEGNRRNKVAIVTNSPGLKNFEAFALSTEKDRKMSPHQQKLCVGLLFSPGLCRLSCGSQPLTLQVTRTQSCARAPPAVSHSPLASPLSAARIKLCGWGSPSLIHLALSVKMARCCWKDCVLGFVFGLCVRLCQNPCRGSHRQNGRGRSYLSHLHLVSPSHSCQITSYNDILQRN